MVSPAGHRAADLSRSIMQANAGGGRLSEILQLDLGLERLSSLSHSLAFCTQLRSLTLSNNRLTSLDGEAVWYSLTLRQVACGCQGTPVATAAPKPSNTTC